VGLIRICLSGKFLHGMDTYSFSIRDGRVGFLVSGPLPTSFRHERPFAPERRRE
jgi:hypothetical protein